MNKKIDTSSEEIIDKKYRNWTILLYKDTKDYNYDDVLFYIKGNFKNYAYIEHQPEREEKKLHTHVIIALDNACTLSSLSKKVGVPSRFIKNITTLRGSCRYLTHIDYPEKTQYDLVDVTVSNSFKQRYFKSFDDLETDADMLSNIYSFIDDYKDLSPIELEIELSKFVCSQSYNRIFKSYYNTIIKYLNYVCK